MHDRSIKISMACSPESHTRYMSRMARELASYGSRNIDLPRLARLDVHQAHQSKCATDDSDTIDNQTSNEQALEQDRQEHGIGVRPYRNQPHTGTHSM